MLNVRCNSQALLRSGAVVSFCGGGETEKAEKVAMKKWWWDQMADGVKV